jgi:hypothetical protein
MKKKKRKSKQKINKKLITKAGLALKNEHYLEATWILSSIMEKKLGSILGNLDNKYTRVGSNLDSSLKRMKFHLLKGTQPFLSKHLEIRFISELRAWKSYRNSVFKDMVTKHVSKMRMKKMAEEGIVLLQELNTLAKIIKSESRKLRVQNTPIANTSNGTKATD